MYDIDKIVSVLIYRGKETLANLLKDAKYTFNETGTYGSREFSILTTVEIYTNIKNYEDLISLAEQEKNEIIKAFLVIYPVKDNDIEINNIEFFVDPNLPILENEFHIESNRKIEMDFWKENYFRLFISHSSKIKSLAHELKESLESYAISAFVAHDDIEPTKEWLIVIEDALRTCDGLIALINQDFHESKWTDQEVGVCFGLNKIIIPIKLNVDPYGFFGKFQGLKGECLSSDSIAFNIFNLLIKKESTTKKISHALVRMFVNSDSFKNAKENMSKLEKIKYIDDSLIIELRHALEENYQINHCFSLPSRLESFLDQFEESNETK